MEKPLLTLKPSIINALTPIFLKYLFLSFILTLILYGIIILIKALNILELSNKKIFLRLAVFLFIFSIAPMLFRIIILISTKYYFFETNLLSEFKFIIIRRHSVPYHQIVNIETKISLWDRFCKAGDIVLHTAEDNTIPDLVLSYMKDPEKIEKSIYHMIHSHRQASYSRTNSNYR